MVIYFFHFPSPDSRDSMILQPVPRAAGTPIDFEVAKRLRSGSRDRATRLRNLSTPLASKTRTRGSSLIFTFFTGRPAGVTGLRIASHRRCIMRVCPHIPRRAPEQKGWNAPALSFLSPCVARILINGRETLRHSTRPGRSCRIRWNQLHYNALW